MSALDRPSPRGALEVRFHAASSLLAVLQGVDVVHFDPEVGPMEVALRTAYDDVVQEGVPDDMRDLLDKL